MIVRLKRQVAQTDGEAEMMMAAEYKLLGDLATEKGKLPLARKCYRKASQLEKLPHDPYKSGLSYFQSEQYAEAIAELRKCLSDDVLKPRAYFYLAYSYLNLGNDDEAEEHFKEALQLNPKDPYVYVGLGVIAQTRKQYGQAKQYYKKALGLDPNCQEANENLDQIKDY